ncbi:hypothetical protein RUM43_014266 [Polyplax serrata]|uniref:Tumor necrosis factor alpha-induced protein 8-like protein n=1 Tax=Polyplax serrata TaxID=468196 RepID=A0AAN8P1B3_POLSC
MLRSALELESWIAYQWFTKDLTFMDGFKARDIGLRAQKKILSHMASKNVAKVFIDDTPANLLDNVFRLAKCYTGNKKEAEKLVKNIIKIVIKVAVLYRNNQFNAEEMKHAERFKAKFHQTAMAIISFYEVDFSYDRSYLLKYIKECSTSLNLLIQHHLTEKSMTRINCIFNFFSNPQFLDAIFRKNTEYYEILGKIVADMNKALDSGEL